MTHEKKIIKGSHSLYKFILKQLTTPILVINSDRRIVYYNDAAFKLLGSPLQDMINTSIYPVIDTFTDGSFVKEWIDKALDNEKAVVDKEKAIILQQKNQLFYYNVELKVIIKKNKIAGGIILIFHMVNPAREAEKINKYQRLYLNIEHQIATILNSNGSHDAICDVIRKECNLHTSFILLVNGNTIMRISGASTILPDFIVEMTKSILIDFISKPQARDYFFKCQTTEKISFQKLAGFLMPEKEIDVSSSFMIEFFSQLKESKAGFFLMTPLVTVKNTLLGVIINTKQDNQDFDDDEVQNLDHIANFINLGIDKQLKEQEIHRMAYYDELTNLTNVKFVKEKIAEGIKNHKKFALLSIKIRNFSKDVSYKGEKIGDKTIIHIADKIKAVLSRYKDVIFSRSSGISFLCCVCECNEQKAKEIVNNILYVFRKPFYVGGNIIHLYTSIGVYFSEKDTDTSSAIQKVNLALEKAKEKAESIYQIKNNYVIYNEKMGEERKATEQLRQELRENLASRKNFVVYYQPKLDINGNITGYEAMVRWIRNGKLILPIVFIGKISEMGLSDHLFNIVLESVCQDIQKIEDKSYEFSINIAPEQFNDTLLIAKINRTLKKYNINPFERKIKFEIVESELVNSKNLQVIKDIHSLGLKISVDDFGSGYSNLKTINELARDNLIDEIKIDRSLIEDITEDSTLLAVILEMAHKLSIDIVAEGVENINQFYVLRNLYTGVILQGWLFSKAIPFNNILALQKDAFKPLLQKLTNEFR